MHRVSVSHGRQHTVAGLHCCSDSDDSNSYTAISYNKSRPSGCKNPGHTSQGHDLMIGKNISKEYH